MIARKWEQIKLQGREYRVRVGLPDDGQGRYMPRDKYGFASYLRFEDNSNISFHERNGVFVGTSYSRLFSVNAVPRVLSGKLTAVAFLEAGGLPLAYRMIGIELNRISLQKGDLAV